MKEQLIHILDESVCLSRRQITAYLSGKMEQEEMHAAEVHISSCPLCSMAIEGFEEHKAEGLAALATLNSDFLKEHFDKSLPQIHLNSIAPAVSLSENSNRGKSKILPLFRITSLAAALLIGAGAFWYFGSDSFKNRNSESLATVKTTESEPSTGSTTAPDPFEANMDAGAMAESKSANGSVAATQPGVAAPSSDRASSALAAPAAVAADNLDAPSVPAPAPTMESAEDRMVLKAPPSRPPAETTYSRAASAQSEGYNYNSKSYGNSYTPDDKYQLEKNAAARDAQATNAAVARKKELSAAAPVVASKAKTQPPAIESERNKLDEAREEDREDQAARQQKSIEAAKVAMDKGQTEKARRLLQAIVDEGGPKRREARKLLRKLRND